MTSTECGCQQSSTPAARHAAFDVPVNLMCKGFCVCVCRITTHQRLNSIILTGPTREEHRISTFNAGMRTWFEAGHCGPAHVVDVYNMTKALVTTRPEEAKPLTHDGLHWSMVVNLVKVQILLNDIAAVLPSVHDAVAPLL